MKKNKDIEGHYSRHLQIKTNNDNVFLGGNPV